MNDIVIDIFDLIGRQIYVDEEILCRDAFVGTIDRIEIRYRTHCTLYLTLSNPNKTAAELNISVDELKQLATTWKINRNNHEIYVKSK